MLDEEIGIKAKDFMPLHEYLHNEDFAPRLIGSDGQRRLQGVLLQEDKDTAAINIAKVYLAASKIQFSTVQDLCIQKLMALYPVSTGKLLIVVMIMLKADQYGCDAEQEAFDWLVAHITECYFILMKNEGGALARLMWENKELSQEVRLKLHQNLDAGWLGWDVD